MWKSLSVLILIVAWVIPAFTQTSLEGKLSDSESGEPLLFATIALYKNGVIITGTETDLEGNYTISNVDPGTYDIEFAYTGFQTQRQEGVILFAGKSTRLDVKLTAGITLSQIEVIDYKVPLIEQDNTTSGNVVTSETIRNLPIKSINSIAATTAGLSSVDGGAISVRGSRSNATDYYIDGIRVTGSLIPQTEIDQLQVITGGIEAKYGDVTGGIISITTKGPSNYFTGGLEVETSEYLDDYGYNLINANLSGPILKKDNGSSIIGFRLSAQYRNRKEDDPPANGIYRLSEDRISSLEENPIFNLQGTPISSGELLQNGDADLLKAAPNEDNTRLDITGKIDARISPSVDLSLSGSYFDSKNRFTPGGWGLLNWGNNPYFNNDGYRGNFRFRHRLGSSFYLPTESDTRKEKVNNSIIKNAQYTLQIGYQKNNSRNEDSRHEDNLFRYGHIGNYDVDWVPVEGESEYSRSPIDGIAHAGFLQVLNGYEPGAYNTALANYNIGLDPGFLTAYNTFNGFISGNFSSVWGLHTNVGAVYNLFNKGESDLYTFNANSSFDIFPGGSDKGRHNIEIGFTFEQRVNRSWGVAPFGLWTIARLQANNHIIGVDTNVVVGAFDGFFTPFTYEQFQTQIVEDNDLLFYKRIRELTGQSLHDYVNVDGLNPDDLSLDLFSASELTDQGIVDYFGFDYLGNKLSTSTKFEDFFTSVDAEGRRTFDVAANKPVYASAYIQDKFTFRDIIFRLGLRVDRYDANTKVLKDPFSLYEITSARDFYSSTGQTQPGNVEDQFLVYVDGDDSDVVKAYRDGEQWYFANGTPANDGNVIFGGEIVYPKLIDEDSDIRSREFDPNSSFEDYEPQINWMPRLAFSFPISDEANFFAHYDILVQRPPSNTLATALDYYYFENPNRTPSNNPNLKPEKTIDYEVGFQQKLSNSSALKISAYYKELRNMIQSRTFLYLPAPVNQYDGFGNIDFGTVKGFSFQYDLRRTANLEMTANYTLQFADGTGSNANSQRGLTSRGNIRTLFPLSFDERHRLVATMDYRYDKGIRYNGPKWGGLDVLANAGINIQATAVSGRPFTRRQRATPFSGTGFVGSINGARLPWNFSLDGRIDKTFRVTPDNMKPVYLNVYVRVLNILDKRNVIGVYPVTGTPEDDGYLISADGQSALNTISISGRDVDAYLASYQWALLNPDLYSLPRRIFLGAVMQF